MSMNGARGRETTIPELDLSLDAASGYPAAAKSLHRGPMDPVTRRILDCSSSLTTYLCDLYASPSPIEFLTPPERRDVAAFIDDLGPNQERRDEFIEYPSILTMGGGRNRHLGWTAQEVREFHEATALISTAEFNALDDMVRDCVKLLGILLDYVDSFHGTRGFTEILTVPERTQVGQHISGILSQPARW